MYRIEKTLDGSQRIRRTSAEQEIGAAAGTAIGWAIGAGIGGLAGLARYAKDRRLQKKVEAMRQAADSGENDRFLSLSKDFVRCYPNMPMGHAAHADALACVGQYEPALRAINHAVELGLDETEARIMRVDLYDELGMTAKAIQECTILADSEAARSDPKFRIMMILGRAGHLITIGDLDQALRDTNDAVGVMPDPSAYAMRGHVYQEMGKLEKCLEDYSRSVQLEPDNPVLLENRAAIYERLGKVEEAESDRSAIAKLREIKPGVRLRAGCGAPSEKAREAEGVVHDVITRAAGSPEQASTELNVEQKRPQPTLLQVIRDSQGKARKETSTASRTLFGVAALAIGLGFYLYLPKPVTQGSSPSSTESSVPQEILGIQQPDARRENLQEGDITQVLALAEEKLLQAKRRPGESPPLKQSDRKKARPANSRGLTYLQSGQILEAISSFQEAYQADPSDVELVNNLGYAYLLNNDLDSAERYVLTALAMQPGRSVGWDNLGQMYAKKGQIPAAVASFTNAYRFSRDPNQTHRYFLGRMEKENDTNLRQALQQATQVGERKFLKEALERTAQQEAPTRRIAEQQAQVERQARLAAAGREADAERKAQQEAEARRQAQSAEARKMAREQVVAERKASIEVEGKRRYQDELARVEKRYQEDQETAKKQYEGALARANARLDRMARAQNGYQNALARAQKYYEANRARVEARYQNTLAKAQR